MLRSIPISAQFIFTRQLAALLAGRLQLATALANLATEMPKGKFRNILEAVVRDVTNGRDLADAMNEYPAAFNQVYVGVVRSGMRSGKIAEALEQLSTYLEQMDAFGRKVRAALTYPLFVVGAFLIVFHMMIFMILPRFEKMYQGMGRELPAPTQMLLDIGAAYGANMMLIVILLGGMAALVVFWLSSEAGKIVWDATKLRLPLIGYVVRHAALARFLRSVGMQLRHGIPAVEALKIGAAAVSNRQLEAAVLYVTEKVERGASIGGAFREAEHFGDIVAQMVTSGEQAGTLDQLMISAADYFETLLMQRIQALTAMINPILTALVGLGIAGMLIAAFLPVFELSGNV